MLELRSIRERSVHPRNSIEKWMHRGLPGLVEELEMDIALESAFPDERLSAKSPNVQQRNVEKIGC